MSVYRVTGRSYREHPHGAVFSANLEPDEERRALDRGSLELVRAGREALNPAKVKAPRRRKKKET
jgi:hypothetical protein